MLTVTRCDSWEELDPLKNKWNDLVMQSPTNEIFLAFEYLKAWAVSHTRNALLEIILIHRDSTLVGVAPLMFSEKQRYGVCLKSLEFIGAPNNDYSDFIYRDLSVLDMLWKQVNESAAMVDLVYLQQIKATSPTVAYLKGDSSLTVRPCAVGLSSKLPESNAPIEQYLKGPGLRKRTLRRIEKEGEVILHTYDSPEAIEANLPILFEQHISRWTGTPTPSFFKSRAIQNLYLNWARALTPDVMLFVLTLNSTPVACLFGFPYGNKFIAHTLTFSTEYSHLHCGLFCIFKTMQALKTRGVEYIDLTRGNEGYKAFFADIETLSYELVLANTWKAKCSVPLYLAAKDFVARHSWSGPIGARFGLRPNGLNPKTAGQPQGRIALPNIATNAMHDPARADREAAVTAKGS